MNRSEYLRDSSVEAFIDWLRPHVRGDCLFQHKFTTLKPHLDWSCNSIWEAYENYWWPIPGRNTGSFEANQGELDRLAADVRRARDGDERRRRDRDYALGFHPCSSKRFRAAARSEWSNSCSHSGSLMMMASTVRANRWFMTSSVNVGDGFLGMDKSFRCGHRPVLGNHSQKYRTRLSQQHVQLRCELYAATVVLTF